MNMVPEFLNYIVINRRGPTYLYYLAFPNDKKVTKGIVAFVYSIDTAQTILAVYDFHRSFCVNKNSLVLDKDNISHLWLTIPLSGTLVATVAQLFYAHRIYALSKKKVITGIVIIGWGSVGMVCDLVIAVYMSWFLTKQMRQSSRTTQVMVTRIKRLVLETGFLTATFATAFAVLLGVMGNTALFTIPGLTLGKLYSNSILVLLNNRFTIAGGRNEPAFEFEANSYHLLDLPRREGAEHGIRE
ncbi:hypothetical protein AGABI1DRAFT_102709 [Agaricus bisporus var. burnettii JB137-S8]|uniref:DUF6534 domain-containing protein n=1 Tax=Agaricus bisporus var. burnettii (strain JB137-S8 / ATCC MYA-4627 / FGSC 10392) TaxID=597362 RepID=K5WY07_AGABU|nr:uncharacterized protein AGABI1DRAFT_102709 [Agaricus bisporus var. burnettii JB137-S8]EKM75693.1 hypothetical protein AGABI1DRAFT_102709 [Agaricus bisporus var. burnettii JB137-S8]